jgi:hypothetical protein
MESRQPTPINGRLNQQYPPEAAGRKISQCSPMKTIHNANPCDDVDAGFRQRLFRRRDRGRRQLRLERSQNENTLCKQISLRAAQSTVDHPARQ